MSINELKNRIYNLIEKSENKNLLEFVFNIFSFSDLNGDKKVEDLWEGFTENQRELILKAFEQSESENNLLSHDSVISKLRNEI